MFSTTRLAPRISTRAFARSASSFRPTPPPPRPRSSVVAATAALGVAASYTWFNSSRNTVMMDSESSTPPSSSGSISSKPTLDSPSPGPSTIGGSAPVPSASTSVLHGERKGSIEEVKKFETDVGDEPGPGAEGDDVRRDAGKGRDREGDTEEGDATGEAHGQQGEGEERDGSQAAAYNEETGEINWDCPCLGDMPHGPCGPQFRAAFSCFVHSEAEIKGAECVEMFRTMQDCLREHPEIYGATDIEDEEDAENPSSLESLEKEVVAEGGLVKPESEPLFANDDGIGSKTA